MNVYLEIFGYIGTALVILSMTMKSINKLRIVNISGAIVSAIYSALISAWPIVLLNVTLTTINLYHVIKTGIRFYCMKFPMRQILMPIQVYIGRKQPIR